MQCSSCGKTISQRSKFCMYCGEKVVAPSPPKAIEKQQYSKDEQGQALADCYEVLLGVERMSALAHLAQIDEPRALKLMKDDVSTAMTGKPLLTQEERNQLLDEILAQMPRSESRPGQTP